MAVIPVNEGCSNCHCCLDIFDLAPANLRLRPWLEVLYYEEEKVVED